MILLHQNDPNPFVEETSIQYHIPYDFEKAQVVIGSIDGSIVKIHNIKQKGDGVFKLTNNDLLKGMYTYSLIIDGENVSTKKMVKQY
jgi:hypothetical protein